MESVDSWQQVILSLDSPNSHGRFGRRRNVKCRVGVGNMTRVLWMTCLAVSILWFLIKQGNNYAQMEHKTKSTDKNMLEQLEFFPFDTENIHVLPSLD